MTIAVVAIAAGLFLGPVRAQQASPNAQDHSMHAPQAAGMMDHDAMMADMKAADAHLEALAQAMTSAQGDEKVAGLDRAAVGADAAQLERGEARVHDGIDGEHVFELHGLVSAHS